MMNCLELKSHFIIVFIFSFMMVSCHGKEKSLEPALKHNEINNGSYQDENEQMLKAEESKIMEKNDLNDFRGDSAYTRSATGKGYEKATELLKNSFFKKNEHLIFLPHKFYIAPYYFFTIVDKRAQDQNGNMVAFHIENGLIDKGDWKVLGEIFFMLDVEGAGSTSALDLALIVACFLPSNAKIISTAIPERPGVPARVPPHLERKDGSTILHFSYHLDGRGINVKQCRLLMKGSQAPVLSCE